MLFKIIYLFLFGFECQFFLDRKRNQIGVILLDEFKIVHKSYETAFDMKYLAKVLPMNAQLNISSKNLVTDKTIENENSYRCTAIDNNQQKVIIE